MMQLPLWFLVFTTLGSRLEEGRLSALGSRLSDTVGVAESRERPVASPRPTRQDDIIDRAIAAWAKVKTLRASFEQSIINPITGSTMKSKGVLQQRKPNRLAIRFTDPEGDRIIADGQHVWVFLPSATPGQVIKMTVAQAGASNTDLIGQFLDAPREKYEITDLGVQKIGTRSARALVLLAKPGQSLPFVRAKVWIDTTDALIRQFESTDANGLSRHVRLLTLSPNATIESSAFAFSVPAGVRVVQP